MWPKKHVASLRKHVCGALFKETAIQSLYLSTYFVFPQFSDFPPHQKVRFVRYTVYIQPHFFFPYGHRLKMVHNPVVNQSSGHITAESLGYPDCCLGLKFSIDGILMEIIYQNFFCSMRFDEITIKS